MREKCLQDKGQLHVTKITLHKRGELKLKANTLRFSTIAVASTVTNQSPAAATVQIRHAKKTKNRFGCRKILENRF